MRTNLLLLLVSSLGLASCGGDGGGVVGTGFSALSGNVSSTDASIGEDADALEGIRVTAFADGSSSATETDAFGRFTLPGTPSGDVTVEFRLRSCAPVVSIPDVVDDSVVELADVAIRCDEAAPDRIEESFVGVLLERNPGVLLVCAESGGVARPRAVRPIGTTVRDSDGSELSVADLDRGDEVRVTGQRLGAGVPSTIEAVLIEILGRDREVRCQR